MEELGTIISDLNRPNSIVLLLGDFNNNLLKIDNTLAIKDYFNDILSLGLFPTITLLIIAPLLLTTCLQIILLMNIHLGSWSQIYLIIILIFIA